MRKTSADLGIISFFTLLVSYSALWTPPYLELLSGDKNNYFLSSNLKKSCNEIGIHNNECLFSYSFQIEKKNIDLKPILNFGVVVPKYKISCDSTGTIIDEKSQKIDQRNSILSVNIKNSKCEKTLDLSIWRAVYYPLAGITSGVSFYASEKFANSYFELVYFFNYQIRLVLLLIFTISISISILSKKLNLPPLSANFPDIYLIPWAGFLFTSSGALAIFTARIIPDHIYVHINSLLSSASVFAPVIFYLISRVANQKLSTAIALAISLTLPLVTPNWLKVYPLIGIVLCALSLIKKDLKRDLITKLYFVILIINFIKLNDGFGMQLAAFPHIHVAAVYLGISYLLSSINRINIIIRSFKINNLFLEACKSSKDLILKTLIEAFDGIKIKECNLYIQEFSSESFTIFTMKENKWEIRETSPANVQPEVLRKFYVADDNTAAIEKDIFNLKTHYIKISDPGKATGLLQIVLHKAITESTEAIEYNALFFDLKKCFERTLSKAILINQLSDSNIKIKFEEELKHCNSNESIFNVFDNFCSLNNIRGFIGEVDKSIKKVVVIKTTRYSKNVSNFLSRLTFTSDNNLSENTPIPLAISKKMPVVLDNINIIKPHLSDYSTQFITWAKSRSLLVFPVFLETAKTSKKREFIIFLDSEQFSRFDNKLQNEVSIFSELFFEHFIRISEYEESKNIIDALSKTIPSHVLLKLKNGMNVRENEEGYLLCSDIIGSTNAYKILGDQQWSQLIQEITIDLKNIAQKFNASLDVVLWDAFFISIKMETNFSELLSIAETVYKNILIRLTKALAGKIDSNQFGVRQCLAYGDITKDFSQGVNKTWTIVGDTMAKICKFESKIKSLGPGLYVYPDTIENLIKIGAEIEQTSDYAKIAINLDLNAA